MVNIVSFNMTHTASVAVFRNSQLVAAISEERLTRSKNDHGFPTYALRECLRIARLQPRDIDRIVYPSNRDYLIGGVTTGIVFLSDSERGELISHPYRFFSQMKHFFAPKKEVFQRIMRGYLIGEGFRHDIPILFVNHHRAHAASAYYYSGFDKALVVTFDGIGDGLVGTVSIGRQAKLKRIHQEHHPCSCAPGLFYGALTAYLGFRPNLHEGKIVGLAAYGNPNTYYPHLLKHMQLEYHTPYVSFKDQFRAKGIDPMSTSSFWKDFLWWPLRAAMGKPYVQIKKQSELRALARYFPSEGLEGAKREDVAAAAQRVFEEKICEYVRFYLKTYKQENLALAGGVFANVKLNQRLFNLKEVKRIFIQPAMGDEGLPLGAGMLAVVGAHYDTSLRRLPNVYLGPEYTDREIVNVLSAHGFIFKRYTDETLAKKIAADIDQGYVVGLFAGRMEFGPRALGNRSVLADPRSPTINDELNARMKRTEFMPFAPSILEEAFTDVFSGKMDGARYAAEYMTITFTVKKPWQTRIPAVVHVDGTARPQIVRKAVNPFYHEVIRQFFTRTGIPLIVNTSFNMHEEPIVATPVDALRAFEQNICDVLVMGNYYVRKT